MNNIMNDFSIFVLLYFVSVTLYALSILIVPKGTLYKIYKDSTIKYKDIEIDDNIATVTVEVKSKNFNSIILRATDVAISNIDLLTPVETLMNNAMWEVYDKEEPEEREVEITLTKLDDTWIIDPESVSNVTYLITGIRY